MKRRARKRIKTNTFKEGNFAYIFFALVFAIALVLIGSRVSKPAYNPSSTSQISTSEATTTAGTVNILHATPLVQQWDSDITHTYRLNESIPSINASVGDGIYATPTVYGGTIFVTTMGNLTMLKDSRYDLTNGSVAAINISTSKIVWRTWLPNQIMTQPIIAGNLLIVGMSNNGEVPEQYYKNINGVYALDIATGKIVWNVTTPSIPTGPDMTTPAYYDGLIIEPGQGTAEIYNATTGARVNSVATGLPDTLSSPLLVNGIAYFGAGYSSVYGFNSFSQDLKGNKVNVTSDLRFFAVNVVTGNIVWQTRFPNAGDGLNDACAAFANGTIVTEYLYQSDYGNPWVVGLNSTTGRVLWEVNETAYMEQHNIVANPYVNTMGMNYTQNVVSPVTIWNGTAYVNSNFLGILTAVNTSTGAVLWETVTGQDESNPNVFYGHYLVTLTDAGELLVLNAKDGSIINATFIGMPHLVSEPIITDNYVILAGMNGRIITLSLQALLNRNVPT